MYSQVDMSVNRTVAADGPEVTEVAKVWAQITNVKVGITEDVNKGVGNRVKRK